MEFLTGTSGSLSPAACRRPAVAHMTATGVDGGRLAFDLPRTLEAGSPPEARGLTRDAVKMLVAHRDTGAIEHSTFAMLPAFLAPGDLVVVNTSATIPAAIDAVAADGTPLVVHLSTQVSPERWVIEPRRPTPRGTARWDGPPPKSPLQLEEATATIEEP